MVQVRYCGPISQLKGHTALAVRLKDKPTKLAVQFYAFDFLPVTGEL
jgi:hypothetical protein